MGIKTLFFLLLVTMISCKEKKYMDINEYGDYIKEDDSILNRTRNVFGYDLSVSYLSIDQVSFNEYMRLHELSENKFVEIRNSYGQGIYFILTIGPDENNRNIDILKEGVVDYADYQKRFMDLTYNIKKMLKLKFSEGSLFPVLISTEHSYGLTKNRSVIVAFVPNNKLENKLVWDSKFLTIEFNDRIFKTGTSNFRFSVEEINELPKIQIK